MAGISLLQFFNPLGNSDGEILGLVYSPYPIVLNAGNSYTYFYGYSLIYDPFSNLLRIFDGITPTVTYAQTGVYWNCISDTFSRPSVLATYFTSIEILTPPIYIRPVVGLSTIRYNWETSTITNATYTLTCTSINGGNGGGTVTLDSNVGVYTYNDLTIGKTYECGFVGSNSLAVGNSTFFRTVTTGNSPGAPESLSFLSTPTTITLFWSAPSGSQTPPIGWYVITDSNSGRQYNTRFYDTSITIPFDGTPHTYRIQSVSDTGYSAYSDLILP